MMTIDPRLWNFASPALARAATCVLLAAMVALAPACARTPEEAPEPEAEEPEPTMGEPRVFFVQPLDGSTVSSPVTFTFGSENFMVEPVGDGAVHTGAGHFHVAVDGDCLEPGIVIPSAAPWIHFGDGSNEIEVPLEPGEHRFCVQVGDGEHRTLDGPGFSEAITITVE